MRQSIAIACLLLLAACAATPPADEPSQTEPPADEAPAAPEAEPAPPPEPETGPDRSLMRIRIASVVVDAKAMRDFGVRPMNVSDAMLRAIWCEAICTVPSVPISSAVTPNAPNSSS